jgi:hypothetical protein
MTIHSGIWHRSSIVKLLGPKSKAQTSKEVLYHLPYTTIHNVIETTSNQNLFLYANQAQ